MIKCKEDLVNTYIENDFGELRELYIKKALEFGFDHQLTKPQPMRWYDCAFIGINAMWNDAKKFAQTNDPEKSIYATRSKRLTISDLKPKRTKVEYLKVTDSIFHLKPDLEAGELFIKVYSVDGVKFRKISDEYELRAFSTGELYRRVEVEIDWRDELKAAIESAKSKRMFGEGSVMVGDADLTDDEFVSLCHLVAELTDKPEGE